jgi:hypothetical protein
MEVQPGLFEVSVSPVDAFDFFLGGYAPYSPNPFKTTNITEKLLFSDTGNYGSVTFIGRVEVDTIAPIPQVQISIWNKFKNLYNLTLTVQNTTIFQTW